MAKPANATRLTDQYKRQLKVLEFYLTGRINQLERIAKTRPAEADACQMAISEFQTVLSQVLPQMREVLP